MKRAIKPATRAEQAYQDAARALGCVVCRWRIAAGLQPSIWCGHIRLHHRNLGDLHGQKQIGQHAVVAMGDWHHQGIPLPNRNGKAMYAIYGPSFQEQAREFRMWTLDVLGGRGTEAWQQYQDHLLNTARAA
ncbi:hypothetical protein OCJ37_14400 [Xanthomonas sp. AM6]|uniref:hypothetical protein n=1 Tax=Xanthomonas sp. AM6 TaxID=2982531 RepID=UPI0021D820BE|nr:hypothetical protein [Xanthomonas sp. AM6]UYB51177.1 hypothetical protein OCJ37_14400 [Xanthomonas sp. AM6]